MPSTQQPGSHADVNCLVCAAPLGEAERELDRARQQYAQAALALTVSRERLERVVAPAYERQNSGLIDALFRGEEAALAVYEEAVATLVQAERRCSALRAALAQEWELMLAGPLPRRRLN
jgi:antitoxin (DNA-binding transcriptional repressor) of toxin-antitoxin stability system